MSNSGEKDYRIAIEGIRKSYKETLTDKTNLLSSETNRVEARLGNNLITLATVLLIFTSPLFTNLENLSDIQKTLLFISWILVFWSIVAGVVQFYVNFKFFDKGASRTNEAEKILSKSFPTEEEYKKMLEKITDLDKDFEIHSTYIPLYTQLLALFIAFVVIILTGWSVLFGVF